MLPEIIVPITLPRTFRHARGSLSRARGTVESGRASGGDSYSRSLLMPTIPDAWGDFGDFRADQLAGLFFTTHASVAFCNAIDRERSTHLVCFSAGSNPASGKLAAEKGMGLAVALFINPDASARSKSKQY